MSIRLDICCFLSITEIAPWPIGFRILKVSRQLWDRVLSGPGRKPRHIVPSWLYRDHHQQQYLKLNSEIKALIQIREVNYLINHINTYIVRFLDLWFLQFCISFFIQLSTMYKKNKLKITDSEKVSMTRLNFKGLSKIKLKEGYF